MVFTVENQQKYIKPKGSAKYECGIRSRYLLGVFPNVLPIPIFLYLLVQMLNPLF